MNESSKQLRIAATGEIVASRLEIASSAWQRVVGLIGRKQMAADAALWLQPCNGIHTFGVRFPIDALFLDKQGCILRMAAGMKPCRICGPFRHAKTVVELPAGTLARHDLHIGMRLEVVSAS